MGKFLINTMDGTVCDLAGTVIVDTDKLDEAGKALLQEWNEGNNDGTACEIGEKYGTPLDKFTDNELTYGNTMAFSGKAMREEVQALLDNNIITPEYEMASKFTDEQFEDLGAYILAGDYLWNVYTTEVGEGITNFVNDVIKPKLKENA